MKYRIALVCGVVSSLSAMDLPKKRSKSQALICVEQPIKLNEKKVGHPLPLVYQGQRLMAREMMEWLRRRQFPLERCLTSSSEDFADVYLRFREKSPSMDRMSVALLNATLLRKLKAKRLQIFDAAVPIEFGRNELRIVVDEMLPCYEMAQRLLERRTKEHFVITDIEEDCEALTTRMDPRTLLFVASSNEYFIITGTERALTTRRHFQPVASAISSNESESKDTHSKDSEQSKSFYPCCIL